MTVANIFLLIVFGILWSGFTQAEELELKLDKNSECQLIQTGTQKEKIDIDFPIELSQTGASISVLKCRLTWEPLLPKFKNLQGGDLKITGRYVGDETSSAKVRGKVGLLGSGVNPNFEVRDIPNGDFELTWPLTKTIIPCSADTKLISTFTYIYRSQEEFSEFKLLGMKLENIQYEPCLEEDKNEETFD